MLTYNIVGVKLKSQHSLFWIYITEMYMCAYKIKYSRCSQLTYTKA